ncbi:hypothetical protein KL936_004362 [Ogataea polymorpha]|nr:hypothetical protein KL936_004362 [Ogataea polymorpha]
MTTGILRLANGIEVRENNDFSVDDFDHIPILDISRMWSDDFEERKSLSTELREVCSKVGFFYAKNHGVPKEIASGPFRQARNFFSQPMEKKMEVYTGLLPENCYYGYHPLAEYNMNGKKYNDLYEAFNFGYEFEEDPEKPKEKPDHYENSNIWPTGKGLENFKKEIFDYHRHLLTLSRRLIRIMALALDLPEDYFDEAVKFPAAGMRLVHYPPQKVDADEQVGIGAHTDFECFTLVNQDMVGGLEVLNKSGNWVKAPYIEDTFVVNVADCLMRLTNDTFVSTVHRVVNNTSGTDRYSCPFFFGVDKRYVLNPLPTCVSSEKPAKYPVTTCGEYLAWRASLSKARRQKAKELAEQKLK